MKNKTINKIKIASICLVSILMFASCSDWNDVESLKIKEPSISGQNPELYAKYLADLRTYKKSDHKLMYAWFDNSEKVPFNRAQRINMVPDSIDVLVLMHPDKLVERELTEIDDVRKNKDIKVIFSLSYDKLKLEYENMLAELVEKGEALPETDEFPRFLETSLAKAYTIFDKYNYDGISVGYNGRSMNHMSEAEKALYISYQNIFIGSLAQWFESKKASKMFVFQGQPQNLADKTILSSCKSIILNTISVSNAGDLTYNLALASIDGVPTDRFVLLAETTSLVASDINTGKWKDGSRAITSTALWVAANLASYDVAGMGVYNVSNDYYNESLIYRYTRNAMSIMNPSIKTK